MSSSTDNLPLADTPGGALDSAPVILPRPARNMAVAVTGQGGERVADLPAPASDDAALSRVEETLARVERLMDAAADPSIDVLVSVVMPVYNEAATIETIVSRVLAVPMPLELIVVDDGSTDGTGAVLDALAERLPFRLLRHERNQGKGAALRSGFAEARGEIVAVQDADLEYDPRDLPMLVKPIADHCCDVMYGSRFMMPNGRRRTLHRFGNRLLTAASNLMTGQRLSDMETCYKVFRRDALQGLQLRQNRFGCEPELTAKLARRGLRIYEMPIRYEGRSYKAGKKIGLRDAISALWCIFRYGVAN